MEPSRELASFFLDYQMINMWLSKGCLEYLPIYFHILVLSNLFINYKLFYGKHH